MILGKKIKECRERLGMSQEELANKLGYKSRSTINKIELGKNDITQHKIVAFAKALETTPAYLMGWEETMEKKNNAIANIVLRLRSDAELLSIVEDLSSLPSDKLQAVKTLISVIKK